MHRCSLVLALVMSYAPNQRLSSSSSLSFQLTARANCRQIVTKLHEILRPFLLRRLKKDVLIDMPAKREVVVYTPMSALQRDYYALALDGKLRDKLIGMGLSGGRDCSQINLTMNLRKIANHPFLFGEPLDETGQVCETGAAHVGRSQARTRRTPFPRLSQGRARPSCQIKRMASPPALSSTSTLGLHHWAPRPLQSWKSIECGPHSLVLSGRIHGPIDCTHGRAAAICASPLRTRAMLGMLRRAGQHAALWHAVASLAFPPPPHSRVRACSTAAAHLRRAAGAACVGVGQVQGAGPHATRAAQERASGAHILAVHRDA